MFTQLIMDSSIWILMQSLLVWLKCRMKYLLNFRYVIPISSLCQKLWSELLNHLHIEHSEISRSNARLSGRIFSAACAQPASLLYLPFVPISINPTFSFISGNTFIHFNLTYLYCLDSISLFILLGPKHWPGILLLQITLDWSIAQMAILLNS